MSQSEDRSIAKTADLITGQLYHDSFIAWVRRTAHRRAVDFLREKFARKREPIDIASIDATDDAGNPYSEIIGSSRDDPASFLLRKEIIQSFGKLPKKRRLLCELYYLEGFNDREIGDRLGMTVNHVTVERGRARKKLIPILERMGLKP
jgi:RNA polymerase sigma factor (sigma-70 family)